MKSSINVSSASKTNLLRKKTFFNAASIKDSYLTLMALPAILLALVFNYIPMFGVIIAFKDFRPSDGILGSKWVGFKNFEFFFTSQDMWRVLRNTLGLNALFIVTGTIFAVAFALMLNELSKRYLVKFYQTVFFFPYFLSWVVVGYMFYAFFSVQYGVVNQFLTNIGIPAIDWYSEPKYWPALLAIVNIWKGVGYSCVIYYAGLMGIDSTYYEAAAIDGASKWQMCTKISLPFLKPLIIILTILSIGRIFYSDFGMFFQLSRDIGMLYPTTDVIDTYVYRALRRSGDIGMSSAVGFFQSMVGFMLVILTNYISKKINKDYSLF